MLALEAAELYRFFHGGGEEVKALRGVDLKVQPGETVALMGPSGSGKSTLLMCLAGVDEPDGGMVRVMAKPISRQPEAERARLRSQYFGIMLQKNNLLPHLTVLENLEFARSLNGKKPSLFELENILPRLGIAERGESMPAQLSGGERARASLAVAIANAPPVLLLDEPTGEVDAKTEKDILSVLGMLAREGVAIVMATHNQAVAQSAGRIVRMQDGKIINGA